MKKSSDRICPEKNTEDTRGRTKKKHLSYPDFVPARLARLRRQNHLTQKQVAEYMGIRQQTYSEFERGVSTMHIEEFISLAKLFNVSLDYITGASNMIREFPKF